MHVMEYLFQLLKCFLYAAVCLMYFSLGHTHVTEDGMVSTYLRHVPKYLFTCPYKGDD